MAVDAEELTNYVPPTYRTYTRTSSREYLSPDVSRGASPVSAPTPDVAPAPAVAAPASLTSPLSTVPEFGPQGAETDSPEPVRAAKKPSNPHEIHSAFKENRNFISHFSIFPLSK